MTKSLAPILSLDSSCAVYNIIEDTSLFLNAPHVVRSLSPQHGLTNSVSLALCEGNPSFTGGFHSQRENHAESVFMLSRQYVAQTTLWYMGFRNITKITREA